MRLTKPISIQLVVTASFLCGMNPLLAAKVNQSQRASCTTGNLHEQSSYTVDKVTSFFNELTRAVASDDKSQVARMISYPLRINFPSGRKRIHSEAEFIAQYGRIITPEMKRLILKHRPQCISRVGAHGFSISFGELWFDEFPGGQIKIFAINPVVTLDE